jgi:hypothetical protein
MSPNPQRQPGIAQRVHAAMHPEADTPSFDPSACRASGCPCNGSIDLGSSGRFMCSWHAWAAPDKHDSVTQGLRSHRWLVSIIGELQALYREGADGEPWIVRAGEFWQTDTRMLPNETECRHWGLYLWRLREELSHRIGLRADAPLPRVRHCDEERFREMFRPAMVDGIREAA